MGVLVVVEICGVDFEGVELGLVEFFCYFGFVCGGEFCFFVGMVGSVYLVL